MPSSQTRFQLCIFPDSEWGCVSHAAKLLTAVHGWAWHRAGSWRGAWQSWWPQGCSVFLGPRAVLSFRFHMCSESGVEGGNASIPSGRQSCTRTTLRAGLRHVKSCVTSSGSKGCLIWKQQQRQNELLLPSCAHGRICESSRSLWCTGGSLCHRASLWWTYGRPPPCGHGQFLAGCDTRGHGAVVPAKAHLWCQAFSPRGWSSTGGRMTVGHWLVTQGQWSREVYGGAHLGAHSCHHLGGGRGSGGCRVSFFRNKLCAVCYFRSRCFCERVHNLTYNTANAHWNGTSNWMRRHQGLSWKWGWDRSATCNSVTETGLGYFINTS